MNIPFLQWWPWQAWRIVGQVDAADEVPDRLPRTGMVLVGTYELPKWLAFDCPCRCGHRILLPVSGKARPRWLIDGTTHITLSPSVDAWHGERHCHYFIKKGKVVWVKNPPSV